MTKKTESVETGRAKHRRANAPAVAAEAPVETVITEVILEKPLAMAQAAGATGATVTVTREEIAKLAYTFWIERDYAHGDAEQDWLRAERELIARN